MSSLTTNYIKNHPAPSYPPHPLLVNANFARAALVVVWVLFLWHSARSWTVAANFVEIALKGI